MLIQKDNMKIGFACIWLKDKTKTRSHVAYSLFQALQKKDQIKWLDLDVSLKGLPLLFHKWRNVTFSYGKIQSKYPTISISSAKDLLKFLAN